VSLIRKLATIAAIATTIASLPPFLSEMAIGHEKKEGNDQGKEDEALEVHDKGLTLYENETLRYETRISSATKTIYKGLKV